MEDIEAKKSKEQNDDIKKDEQIKTDEDIEKNKIDKKEADEQFLSAMRDIMGIKQKVKLPDFPINKKIQNKLLKDTNKKKSNSDTISNISDNQKETTTEIKYPSGIIKITKKVGNKIIEESVDYSNIKEAYINNIKNNLDEELKIIIENCFLLYNRRDIIRKIIKTPLSTKVFKHKILIWKYYITTLTKEEKASLIRKVLFIIGKFSKACYKEFISIKEIANAYLLFSLKGKISKNNTKTDIWMQVEHFYMASSMLGYDVDGNPEESKSDSNFKDEANALLLIRSNILNIKEELAGNGFGFVFLKELKIIEDMYTYASIAIESIFHECYDIFDINSFILPESLETFRILWNFFVDYFVDDSFVINFLTQLKLVFGVYHQHEIVKFIHNIVLIRYNIYDILQNVYKQISKIIGPGEELDESEKVEKMDNIDELMKYIENDDKPKKKKKKKKKNKNPINMLDDLIDKKNNENNSDECEIDDGISMISEADSILDNFKNDILAETEYNTGKKIIPSLSSAFMNKYEKEKEI